MSCRFVKYRILKLFEPLLVVTLVVTFGMLLSMSVSECHPNGYVAEIRSVQVDNVTIKLSVDRLIEPESISCTSFTVFLNIN